MKHARTRILLSAMILGALGSAYAQGADHPKNEPLKVASDFGLVPFSFKNEKNQYDGFAVDMANEIAKRLGRPGVEFVDSNFSAIFPGLFAKRYEFIIAVVNITEDRAKQMLFSEPYMPTGLGFIVKSNSSIKSLGDLKGKTLGVNNGSFYDTWAKENAAKYGFSIQRFNKNTDALQALLIGRADVNVVDIPIAQYMSSHNPLVKVGFVVKSDRNYGYAFRKDDMAFRNEVENALECMKQDGTYTKIFRKWFGEAPEAGTSATTVYPGYGAPGFEGYDAQKHELQCSK